MKYFILILSLFSICCTPKLQPVSIQAPQRYIYSIQPNEDSMSLQENWWIMFGDTTLNRLITTALAKNNNLQQAVSRIEEARASLRSARSPFLPSFTLGRSASVGGNGNGDITQQYILEPAMSWEIPLFGSLKHTTTAAIADIEYAKWQYRGVKLSLSAQVATTYFTLLQYRRDLDIAKQSARLRQMSAVLIDSLFVRGMASGVNREQAYNLFYTALVDVPLYERAVKQTLLSLDVLMGQTPDSTSYATTAYSPITDYKPIHIPAGVPADLLYRRPDIMSAYEQLVTAAAQTKLARVARFPNFTLTGEGGLVSDDIKEIFSSNSWLWNLLLSMSQPLYKFGALRSQERAAVERYNQALYAYRESFLTAVADVEDALISISTYRVESERYRELIASNRRIADLTMSLYRNGLTAYLDVIDAERTLYNSQMEYSNIIAQQYINYINLCKALGGGYAAYYEQQRFD